ncbi:vacuolar sorting-associated protein 13 [Aureococcus anophagefferens]|nr:vacuolar sorting-associated protein 13 [Aureococcus anophagefferens]
MLSYLLEKFVRRLCGRWLRNFSAENLSVSLGGTVSFDDLWLNTSELNKMMLPFEPVAAHAAKLRLELPLNLSGAVTLTVDDVDIYLRSADYDVDGEAARRAVEIAVNLYWANYLRPPQEAAKKKGDAAKAEPEGEHQSATALSDTISSIVKSSVLVIRRVHVRVESPRPGTELGDGQGRKKVIQCRFNVSDGTGEKLLSGCVIHKLTVDGASPAAAAENVVAKKIRFTGVACYCGAGDGASGCDEADAAQRKQRDARVVAALRGAWPRAALTDGAGDATFGDMIYGVDDAAAKRKALELARRARCLGPREEAAAAGRNRALLRRGALRHDAVVGPRGGLKQQTPPVGSDGGAVAATSCARGSQGGNRVIQRRFNDLAAPRSGRADAATWRAWFDEWRGAARYVAIRKLLHKHVRCGVFRDESSGEAYYELGESSCVTRAGKFYVHPCQLARDEVGRARRAVDQQRDVRVDLRLLAPDFAGEAPAFDAAAGAECARSPPSALRGATATWDDAAEGKTWHELRPKNSAAPTLALSLVEVGVAGTYETRLGTVLVPFASLEPPRTRKDTAVRELSVFLDAKDAPEASSWFGRKAAGPKTKVSFVVALARSSTDVPKARKALAGFLDGARKRRWRARASGHDGDVRPLDRRLARRGRRPWSSSAEPEPSWFKPSAGGVVLVAPDGASCAATPTRRTATRAAPRCRWRRLARRRRAAGRTARKRFLDAASSPYLSAGACLDVDGQRLALAVPTPTPLSPHLRLPSYALVAKPADNAPPTFADFVSSQGEPEPPKPAAKAKSPKSPRKIPSFAKKASKKKEPPEPAVVAVAADDPFEDPPPNNGLNSLAKCAIM